MDVLNAAHIASVIEAHCKTLSARDRDGWLELWADDAVLEDPVGLDTFRGKETIGTVFWKFVEDLSPMKIWLERDVIVCGQEAIGLLSGVVSKGGQLSRVGPIVDHFVFNEQGKIASMRAFWKYA